MAARKSPSTGPTWPELEGLWKRSGLSMVAFCRRRNVSQSGLYAWRHRQKAAQAVDAIPEPSTPRFLPVKVVAPAQPPNGLEFDFELRGGRVLTIRGSLTAVRLAEFVAALEAQPC